MKSNNYFAKYDWETVLISQSRAKDEGSPSEIIKKYHNILSPDYPDFLVKYISLPLVQRLKGVGLLCGTDWTPLYKNRFYYSRLDHSIGVALIAWHFTQNKAQTIAALLHDVSTPVFSHVSDFRKGDALTQTVTEEPNATLIKNDSKLIELLEQDNLNINQVEDYHIYPICDNEIPCLSADRLEYMFPSGMILEGSWNLSEIKRTYDDITILRNEQNQPELGFKTLSIAEEYCRKVCMTGHVLQLNENKLTLQLLGHIMNCAVEEGALLETDFMELSEKEILEKLDRNDSEKLSRLLLTFTTMTKIGHTQKALPSDEYFCVNLKVKQRYINPLVEQGFNPPKRLSELSQTAKNIITDFLDYEDTPFGCVKII